MRYKIRKDGDRTIVYIGVANSNPFVMTDFVAYECHTFKSHKSAMKYIESRKDVKGCA